MPLSPSALSRLSHQHETIRELVGDEPEKALRRALNPGKWSAFDNIAHLACYQGVFLLRLERIQMETSPAFGAYVADTDPNFPGYQQRSLPHLFTAIESRRSALLNKLEGMSEDALLRTATHPRYGLLDTAQWTEFFLLHEAHHLYTIFMLVQGLRKPLQ
jgi:DinB superfamily